jgi:hypothetical protein
MRKSVLMLSATLLLAGCTSDKKTPKQAPLPSQQVTTAPVALQPPTADIGTQDSPQQQPAQASSTDLASSGIVVNGFYSGMTWDEGSGVMSTGHKAWCKNSGGLGADVRYTKSCKIHYGDLDMGGPSGYSLDTMLMFYKSRLYLINSNYRSVKSQKEIKLAFGKPQTLDDEGPCWYRGGVLYRVIKNGGENDTDTVEVVDFNDAPPSLRAQRKGNPMCGGVLAN